MNQRRILGILILLAILLNPFDIGLWFNKTFGDIAHIIVFSLLVISIWFLLPQKTTSGKGRFLKRTFSMK